MAVVLGYDYQATLTVDNPGFAGEEIGANPGYLPWTAGETSGSHTASYYYSDSNARNADGTWGNMANSSKVFVTVTDSWTASVNDDNEIIIQLTTTIDKIERKDIQGNPNLNITNGRDIKLSRSKGSPILWSTSNDAINVVKVLATNIPIGTERIVLKPGASADRFSLYLLNHTSGVPETEPGSTDEMHCGVSFRNNLPADYRPGATWTGYEWGCNNRTGGNAAVYNGSSWVETRTKDGGAASDNPPLGYNDNWLNQYKIPNQNG